MPSFSPGDPVLIVGGLTEEDRILIGHATTVIGRVKAYLMPEETPYTIYCVEESYTCEYDHVHKAYRGIDLMPLGPLEDEVTDHADQNVIQEVYSEHIRLHAD